jgi:anthranilate synthase component 1
MTVPSLARVRKLAAQGNMVPVWRELPADLETPVSVYLKLRGEGPSFLLESVERGEQVGRYSFLGIEPAGILTVQPEGIYWQENGHPQRLEPAGGDPLVAIRSLLQRYQPVADPELPRFCGGLVGYLGYEVGRYLDRVPLAPHASLALPEAILLLADQLVIFDHVKSRLLVMANAHLQGDPAAAYREAEARIDALVARLREPLPAAGPTTQSAAMGTGAGAGPAPPTPAVAGAAPQAFQAAVRQAQEHIAAGDIFQVVLSQRLSRATTADPFSIYRALRRVNPSPYMFYLALPGALHLIGSSPEMLVRLEGRQAEVRPIAGTRRRGATLAEDKALAAELLEDPKERAEHVMLVDLGRNDLGRVCRYGTVHVPEMMGIERYSHVMHLVSQVQGELRPELDALDLLRATFPAGTVSGAPKVRAMEIIAELEGEQRGPYAGAVGYFGFSGNMDTCIAIRTMVMQGNTVHMQAGAGIVADSDPEREYEETLNKARALMETVALAEAARPYLSSYPVSLAGDVQEVVPRSVKGGRDDCGHRQL